MSAAARTWREEPLLRFAVAAAVVFALHAVLSPAGVETIHVTEALETALVAEREQVIGRALDAADRDALMAEYVDKEILVREARARGLDERDAKIRERLVWKMMYLLEEEPGTPTRRELEAFLDANAGRYRLPPTVDLQHVFFETPPADGGGVLARLRAGERFDRMGDAFWLGRTLTRISEPELITSFGPEFAERVAALRIGVWEGPISSVRGTHFARVTDRHPEASPVFASVEPTLRRDWLRAQRERVREARMAELREAYVVHDERGKGR